MVDGRAGDCEEEGTGFGVFIVGCAVGSAVDEGGTCCAGVDGAGLVLAGVGATAADTVAFELVAFKVPFSVTSCNILLEAIDAGFAAVGLGSLALAVVVFFAVAVLPVAVAFALFFTTAASSAALTVFVLAFVLAFLVLVFFTSSTLSSTIFLGRPRPRFGGIVVVSVVDIMTVNWCQSEKFKDGACRDRARKDNLGVRREKGAHKRVLGG
jgi:hypothetical protein